jgi:hypothetical protein
VFKTSIDSIKLGLDSIGLGNGAIAIGNTTSAGDQSIVIGHDNEDTYPDNSIIIGNFVCDGVVDNSVKIGNSEMVNVNIGGVLEIKPGEDDTVDVSIGGAKFTLEDIMAYGEPNFVFNKIPEVKSELQDDYYDEIGTRLVSFKYVYDNLIKNFDLFEGGDMTQNVRIGHRKGEEQTPDIYNSNVLIGGVYGGGKMNTVIGKETKTIVSSSSTEPSESVAIGYNANCFKSKCVVIGKEAISEDGDEGVAIN